MTKLAELRARRDELQRIAAKFGITNLRVFGSVARGDQNPTSDVDLLVTIEPGRGLFDLIGFEQEVSEAIGVTVQAISERGLAPRLGPRVLAEAQTL